MSITTVPFEGMRGIIASRMQASLQSTAQYTLEIRADATSLLQQRSAIPKEKRASVTNLLIWLVADCLQKYPYMNGTSDEKNIYLNSEVNMGIAVATPNGLMVPVMHDVCSKSIDEISVSARDLAERAKIGKLRVKEFSGGTFTISNLGMYGIEHFTPVINAPEIAILGVGNTIMTPVPGKEEGVEWHSMLPLSLTIDHRCVDGSDAADFLRAIKNSIEECNLSGS